MLPPDHSPQSPRENLGARRLGRAGFLGLLGGGVGTLFLGDTISRITSTFTKPFADATGLSRIVPSSGWRIYTVADTMPTFDRATWRLRIDGLVHSPLEISYAQLLALPKAQQVSNFHCVTGWIVNGVHWGGVRFADLLAAAGPPTPCTSSPPRSRMTTISRWRTSRSAT
jgi:Oxidoreductase molybdopterin binding domain